VAQAQGELALMTQFGKQRSAKGSNLAFSKLDTPIQNGMMRDTVIWSGVVIKKAIDVIEPKALGILVWTQMGEALNVALTKMARSVSHLLRSGAELRLH
jgi:hypothetical protein